MKKPEDRINPDFSDSAWSNIMPPAATPPMQGFDQHAQNDQPVGPEPSWPDGPPPWTTGAEGTKPKP